MSKLLRVASDLAVAAFLAMALLGVYHWESRTEVARPRPASDAELTVTTEEQTHREELPPEPLRLAVTPAAFDDMGKLLDALGGGFPYDIVADADLEDPAVCQRYDVIFLTCAESKSRQSLEKLQASLRQFVSQGGTLYASDLRFDLLAAAFPEFVDATAVAQGTSQDVVAEVLEPGLQSLLGNELPLHFDLDGWRPAAFGGRDVTVYLKGAFQTTAGVRIEAPLLVKFPVGNGTVLFTSFHNEKQHNDAEVELLKHLVFTLVTAQVESRVSKTMISGGFSPQQQNLLSATADHPSVTSRYEHRQAGDLQFALGFERQNARLRLEVKSPDGKSFVQQGDATFTINVPAAAPGTWQYTVVAEQLPYPNFPFTLTVGAVATEVVAGAKETPSAKSVADEPGRPPTAVMASGSVTFREIELQPPAPAKKWRIGVTPPAYDDMGKLLDSLGEGYRYETLPMDAFLDADRLAQFDVIFLTCAGQGAGTPPLHQNLRRFVTNGGTLYASDLRYPMIAATFREFVGSDAGAAREARQKQLEQARQELQRLLAADAGAESLTEALGKAGLSPALADKLEPIADALRQAGLADKPRPPKTAITRALSDAGLGPVSEPDLDALAKAIHDRALKINRAKHEAGKEAKASNQVRELEQRIAILQQQLASGLEVAGLQNGVPQNLTADVVEPGLQERLGPTMDLHFNLGGWIPAYFAGKDVTVYLRGKFLTGTGTTAEAPLLVSFPVGQGMVIYTAFHNEAQHSEAEKKLLEYLVFTAVTAKQESLVAKTMTSGGFSPAKRSLISHSAGDPSVTQLYRNDRPGRLQFALSFAAQGARLRFTILAPTGQKYEREVESTLVVEVPDAPAGAWQYTVTALQVPYENFPFSVNVGQETQPREQPPPTAVPESPQGVYRGRRILMWSATVEFGGPYSSRPIMADAKGVGGILPPQTPISEGAAQGVFGTLAILFWDFPIARALRNDGFVVEFRSGPFQLRWLDTADQLWVIPFDSANAGMDETAYAAVERFVEEGKGVYLFWQVGPSSPDAIALARRLCGAEMGPRAAAASRRGDSPNREWTIAIRGRVVARSETQKYRISHEVDDHPLLQDVDLLASGLVADEPCIAPHERMETVITRPDGEILTAVYRMPNRKIILDGGIGRYAFFVETPPGIVKPGYIADDYPGTIFLRTGRIRLAVNAARYLAGGEPAEPAWIRDMIAADSASTDADVISRFSSPDASQRLAAVLLARQRRLDRPDDLIRLLRDAHPDVRQAARQALVQLSVGYDFGPGEETDDVGQAEAVAQWSKWRDWRNAVTWNPDDAAERAELLALLRGRGWTASSNFHRCYLAMAAGQRRLPLGNTLIGWLEAPETAARVYARLALVELALGRDFGPELDASDTERAEAIGKWKSWWASQTELVARENQLLSAVGGPVAAGG